MCPASVGFSERWNRATREAQDLRDEIVRFVGIRFLTHYVPLNYKRKRWDRRLSPGYKKAKVAKGGVGIADLLLSRKLLRASTVEAAESAVVRSGRFEAAIPGTEVPYATTHYRGDRTRNISQRNFWEFEAHADDLVDDLHEEWDAILTGTSQAGKA